MQPEHTSEKPLSVVMMGATGAVGGEVVSTLQKLPQLEKLTLLGRRPIPNLSDSRIHQREIDIFTPSTYRSSTENHDCAICTLGVGQPSKISKADYLRIDKQAVVEFARECKRAGVSHFSLLCSVGADHQSRSFFLRAKGELQEELKALDFERLSLFQPSMILTESNRYGFSQALTLAVWPWLGYLMVGGLSKFRGIKVSTLGQAMALNTLAHSEPVEILQWSDINRLAATATA